MLDSYPVVKLSTVALVVLPLRAVQHTQFSFWSGILVDILFRTSRVGFNCLLPYTWCNMILKLFELTIRGDIYIRAILHTYIKLRMEEKAKIYIGIVRRRNHLGTFKG